jgi:hypothetical protein
MLYALGALAVLVSIIALIKYLMHTSESKDDVSVDSPISPPEEEITEKDDELLESNGIEVDYKDKD